MGAPRFFINKITGRSAEISGGDYDHAVNVLRLGKGEKVKVFNYEYGEYEARIAGLDRKKRKVFLEIQKQLRKREGPGGKISAVVSLVKNDKFEFIIQKLTEIGIDEIIPYEAKRSVVKIKDREKKMNRWKKIIYSAVKQCGRMSAPVLQGIIRDIGKFDAEKGADKFFIWEKEEDAYLIDRAVKLKKSGRVYFITGPEGGFEDSEAGEIKKKGFVPVSMGNTVLRAETAVIAAAAIFAQVIRRGKWKNWQKK